MNRRDFMGTVVAGIAMAKFGTARTSEHRQGRREGTQAAGSWIENGMIDAGGTTSPLSS